MAPSPARYLSFAWAFNAGVWFDIFLGCLARGDGLYAALSVLVALVGLLGFLNATKPDPGHGALP